MAGRLAVSQTRRDASSLWSRTRDIPTLPSSEAGPFESGAQIIEIDSLGRKHGRHRSTGPDDFLHAEVYDNIAVHYLVAAEAGLLNERGMKSLMKTLSSAHPTGPSGL